MSALWTSSEIAAATGGMASKAFEANGVAFDSREVGPGDLFIALKGEVTNGHRFLDQAFAKGATGAIVSETTGHPSVRVTDTTAALDALGIAGRARSQAKIAGITGSVGKTGTKEALAAALARASRKPVHRSVKSYNNHTGVPLSLARMPVDSAFGVFETGMNHAGEIAALTRMVRPHVALITAIAPAHIEFFANGLEGIADAKGEIFEGLEAGGTAIIPHDSEWRDRLIEHAQRSGAEILTFGRGEGASVRATEAFPVDDGTMVTVQFPDRELSFTLSQPGDHWVSNSLAVLAAVYAFEEDLAAAALALSDFGGLEGRGAMFQAPVGDGEALIIDESYNANPTSMRATLKVLADTPAARHIAVLGAMRELGDRSDELHAELAEPIAEADVDLALLVGQGIEPLAKALEGRVETIHCADATMAEEALIERIRPDDAILIKGSNAIGLGRIVNALKAGMR